MSASGIDGATMPALLTSASRRPNAVATASNIAMTSASFDTSPATTHARPPASRTARAVSSAAAASRV